MVGGKVINIVKCNDSTWVQVEDTGCEAGSICAIRVKDAKEMKVGDKLWWQGNWAMWTPWPSDGREDIKLERCSYSHSIIPDDVIEKLL